MSKSSLFIGINDYLGAELYECVNDAVALSDVLEHNNFPGGFRPKNFGGPNLLLSPESGISQQRLVYPEKKVNKNLVTKAIDTLFNSDSTELLLYFSGHSEIDHRTGTGYLKTPDMMGEGEGVSFSEILKLANKACNNGKQCVIILDSCNSGGFGDNGSHAAIANGLTIMAASRANESAIQGIQGSIFTRLLIDGLEGRASDLAGRITPASLYAYIDTSLGNFAQRPVFKSNVNRFNPLRHVIPKVPIEVLRNIHDLFKTPDGSIQLDPEFEPTPQEDLPEKHRGSVPDPEKVKVYLELRALNRNGLAVPNEVENLYDAAMEFKTVKLTDLGKLYFRLSKENLI